MKTVIFTDIEELSIRAAELFYESAVMSIKSSGRFTAALSGGRTPLGLYSILGSGICDSDINWGQVHIFWSDERCVGPDDKDSNYLAAFGMFLSKVLIPDRNIHRMIGEKGPEEGARLYDKELRDFFGDKGIPSFDLIILGIGEDGHTASIFPGSEALHEKRLLAAPVRLMPSMKDRITLTLPVLNNAGNILFLVTGTKKAGIIADIMDDSKRPRHPAGMVRPVNGELSFFLDEAAASQLKQKG